MENMNFDWGVPTQRKRRTEKYNTPVITLNAIEKKGDGRKFSFNKAAQELLKLQSGESCVSFGFKDTNVFVGNTTGRDVPNHKITKSYTFSDAKAYNYIINLLGLDETIENELHFNGNDGEAFYTISGVTNVNATDYSVGEPNVENTGITLEEPEYATEVGMTEEEIADSSSEW